MAGSFVSLRGTLALQTSNNVNPTIVTSGAIAAGAKVIIVGSCDKEVLSGLSGGGVTWTVVRHQGWGVGAGVGGTNIACFVAYADAPAGIASGTTLTFTFSGTGVNRICASIEEWSGLATGAPASTKINSNQGTSTTPDSGATTDVGTSGDALVGVTGWGGNVATGTWTAPGGYSKSDHETTGAVTPIAEWAAHRSNTAAAARMNPTTTNGSTRWTSIAVLFPQAVVVSPGYSGIHQPGTPYVVTEIAFASNPADAAPVWTDVSQYVKEVHTKLGRSNPLEDVDAGTCNFIVDNRDRRFEPLYSGSPYYPNVIPLKRIRSYMMENPLVDSGFENKNVAGAWVAEAPSTITVPAYGTTPAPVFRDYKLQVTLGAGGAGGVQQLNAVFQKMPVAGEYVGVSVYVYSSKAGAIRVAAENQVANQFAFTSWTLAANTWTRICTYGVVPAGSTSFGIVIEPDGGGAAWANGDIFYVDAAQLHNFHTSNVNFVPALGTQFDVLAPYTETIYLFDGFVEGWPQIWEGGMQADVQIMAVDGFKPLAPMQAVKGFYNLIVMDDLPTWYFRLGEQLNTQAAQNEVASGIQDGAFLLGGGYPQVGQTGPIPGDFDTAVKFGGGATSSSDCHKASVQLPSYKFAVETWIKCDSANPGRGPDNNGDPEWIFGHGDSSDGFGSCIDLGFTYLTTGAGALYTGRHPFIEIYYGQNWGSIRIYILNPLGTAAYWTSWHHLAVSWDGTGADGKGGWPRAYLDGVEIDLSSAASKTYSTNCNVANGTTASVTKPYLGKITNAGKSRTMYIGADFTGSATAFGVRNVTLDEFAYYVEKIPSDGWAARHYAALGYGQAAEDSGARAGHILDLASISGNNPWPAGRRQIDTGISQVIGWRWNEEKLVDLLKQDAKSEGGIFFFHPNGKATFQNRWHTIQYPYSTPKATLTDAPVSGLPPYEDIGSGGLDYDDQDIYNDVSISRFSQGYGDASGQQNVQDATSQQKFLIRSLTLDDSIVTTDAEALNAANWYLNLFKNPGLKAKNLQVEPLDQPQDLFRVVSTVMLNDRLSVVRHPPPGSGTLSFEVLVMGIQYDLEPGGFHVNYSVYPGPSRDYWQLPDSATNDEFAQYSVLGSTTRLAY